MHSLDSEGKSPFYHAYVTCSIKIRVIAINMFCFLMTDLMTCLFRLSRL